MATLVLTRGRHGPCLGGRRTFRGRAHASLEEREPPDPIQSTEREPPRSAVTPGDIVPQTTRRPDGPTQARLAYPQPSCERA